MGVFNEISEKFYVPFACDAVTGVCMMTQRELFLKLGGFDEVHLPIAYNDVEYCLSRRCMNDGINAGGVLRGMSAGGEAVSL